MLTVDCPQVAALIVRGGRTPAEQLAALFWSSADWRRREARWLEQLAAIRKLDPDLGDALEDTVVEAIALAITFPAHRCDG